MLRYKADLLSLFFLALTIGLFVFLWQSGELLTTPVWAFLYSWQLLMAVIVSVMVHNHQHLSMWTVKWLNVLTDNVLTVFYGFPIFAWIPTHNSNHHVHINKEPDYTKTYMASEKNHIGNLVSYPTLSGFQQQKAVRSYFFSLFNKDRRKFYFHLLQVISLVTWIVVAFVIDWRKAFLYVVIPQQVSLFTVLVFNYIQHIHADEESKYNHSRNMTGGVLNFLLLNNGLHTAHHVSPHLHWSKLREKHNKIVDKIDPRLNEHNFGWYIFRVYILGLFSATYRTDNMRMERIQKQQ
ncbi:MAG: fatty acid desaturase [Saprospiraceae bacterium]